MTWMDESIRSRVTTHWHQHIVKYDEQWYLCKRSHTANSKKFKPKLWEIITMTPIENKYDAYMWNDIIVDFAPDLPDKTEPCDVFYLPNNHWTKGREYVKYGDDMNDTTEELVDNIINAPDKLKERRTRKSNKIEKGVAVSNEAILRAHIKNTPAYKKYMDVYDVSDFEQVDIDEMMRMSGQPGHYFGIKYPVIEGAFVVFKEMLPTLHPVYAAVKYGFPGAKTELLRMLPPYQLLIRDLPEGQAPPSDEEISAELGKFLDLWIEMNIIDELELQRQLREGIPNEQLSEEHQGQESGDPS